MGLDRAREALSLITVPSNSPVPATDSGKSSTSLGPAAEEFFDEMEIYPGSKITHFKAIHNRTGIPYTEMVFFDDETRNREVESLGNLNSFIPYRYIASFRLKGVTFIWVVDGLDKKTFNIGLEEWRKRRRADSDS